MDVLIACIVIFFVIPSIVFAIVFPTTFVSAKKRDAAPQSTKRTREETLGDEGERIVSRILKKYSKEKDFYIIDDFLFSDNRGNSAQVDHIFINENGIFIIETKNHSGRIYGNDTNDYWTQILAYGQEKHKLYNPVRQNAKHIEKLKSVVSIQAPIFGVVVFVKADIRFLESEYVTDLQGLRRLVWSQTGANLDARRTQYYYEQLTVIKDRCKISKEEHVRRIKNAYGDGEQSGYCYSGYSASNNVRKRKRRKRGFHRFIRPW